MAAWVQDLPADALFPATICNRAWSETSPLNVLATRRLQACLLGAAMASMHPLPLCTPAPGMP